jgi:DNA repair photolyase
MRQTAAAARSILTATGGFLDGFTHTLNPYRGCSYARGLCGVYCYASETRYGKDRAEPWGSYLVAKEGAAALYRDEARRLRERGKPPRIFCSSVTDPYVPQERSLLITRSILEAMLETPPELLVLQTRSPLVVRDLDLLAKLRERARVVVQLTVETDRDRIEGLPPHATPLCGRLGALDELRAAGLPLVAVVSPLLPLEDERAFAATLASKADAVILDHWLLGDVSKAGARTKRRRAHAPLTLPEALERAGFGAWNTLEPFERVRKIFEEVLGCERVGISESGFRRAAIDPAWPPTSS